jgi:DNA mismatch endonuclease, patch repair protein
MDRIDAETRSRIMRTVRTKDTSSELSVRRIAHAMGYRFRLHRLDLPGKPDIVFPKHRVAVFVHGCFWHSHANCPKGRRPTSNVAFWGKKLDQNEARDQRVEEDLKNLGWRSLVVWECETARAQEVERKLRRALKRDGNVRPKLLTKRRYSGSQKAIEDVIADGRPSAHDDRIGRRK